MFLFYKMKQLNYFIVLIFFFTSCQQPINKEDLIKINGYWEIQKVTFPDGNEKEYTINETIDFFEWRNNTGFRKKLKPQFDGTFLTNDEQEQIQIKDSAEVMYVFYSTKFDTWKEEINVISDSILVLKNKDNTSYHYKRFTPYSIK
jgi:hypothetical protein